MQNRIRVKRQFIMMLLPFMGLMLLTLSCNRSETPSEETRVDVPRPSGEAQGPDKSKSTEPRANTPAPEISADAPMLADVYSTLSSGTLKHAQLTDLPSGIILRTEGLEIAERDLEKELSDAPPQIHAELRKNKFFLLEQKATNEMLEIQARRHITDANLGLEEVIQRFIEQKIASVKVTDAEIEIFYEANRQMIGDAPLSRIRPAIERHLLQEKQQDAITELVGNLARNTPVALSAQWVKEQAALTLDNPLDRARGNGKPTFASFGADSCMPCQMMKPFREAIADKYGDRLNVVYVHVNQEQMLSSRYGVRGIPHIIFFDATGREVHAQTGMMSLEQLESWIAKLGVAQ